MSRIAGWADAPLTTEAREEAADLGKGLRAAGIQLDAAASADTLRHVNSLDIALASGEYELNPAHDARFREIAFGSLEGVTMGEYLTAMADARGYENVEALQADLANINTLDLLDSTPEASARYIKDQGWEEYEFFAETSGDVQERAVEALNEMAEKQAEEGGGSVLILSSGATITCVLSALGQERMENPDNLAVSELTYDSGQWEIKTINDKSYVEAGAVSRSSAPSAQSEESGR